MVIEFDHPDIGRVRQPKRAARFDRTLAAIQRTARRRRTRRGDPGGIRVRRGGDRTAGGRKDHTWSENLTTPNPEYQPIIGDARWSGFCYLQLSNSNGGEEGWLAE